MYDIYIYIHIHTHVTPRGQEAGPLHLLQPRRAPGPEGRDSSKQ